MNYHNLLWSKFYQYFCIKNQPVSGGISVALPSALVEAGSVDSVTAKSEATAFTTSLFQHQQKS